MFNRNFLESPHTEEERIPHPELLDVLDKTRRFYNDPKSIEFLKSQFESLAHLFRFKDYYVGILGVGYPFYNLNQEGFGELDEFEKFISETEIKIQEDAEENPDGFACKLCQRVNNLPDLKTFCEECEISKIKPRDIFKVLPDLDVFLVTEEVTPTIEEDVESVCHKANFLQSDNDIHETIVRIQQTYSSFEGEGKEIPFPVDLHLVAKEQLLIGLEQIRNGDIGYELPVRSMWSKWMVTGIPLFFDFVFSLTEDDSPNQEVHDSIEKTWAYIRAMYTFEELLSKTRDTSPRADRLLREEHFIENLRSRYTQHG